MARFFSGDLKIISCDRCGVHTLSVFRFDMEIWLKIFFKLKERHASKLEDAYFFTLLFKKKK